jgi:hypothetical protein
MVAGDDRISLGGKRALQNPVVGFIVTHDAQRFLWTNKDREVADCCPRFSHPQRGPAELASQNATDLVERIAGEMQISIRPARPRASTSSAVPAKFNAEM